MRAPLLLLLIALPLHAQGSGHKPKKPVFDVPLPAGDAPPTAEEAEEERDALKNTLGRLAGWPGERSRRAAERLIVLKEKSYPLVLDILVSQDPRVDGLKPGAAYVIGRIGEKSHCITLLLVAAEKSQHRHASVFLEAAARLNEEEAVAEAFRFFQLSETTLRGEAVRFVRERISRRNLPAVLDLLDRTSAERPFTREIGLQLLDRLLETKEVSWEDASVRFYAALGDESPQVASRAMRLVASRNDEANIAALNGLITKKHSFWRQRSYAALAMSILSSAFKVQPLLPETIAVLRGEMGMRHRTEMLAQASAALALAQAALRTRDNELVRLLDRDIPIILIEAVGAGNRHYRDFASVMPLAYTMLRRITGENFADQAPLWGKWWLDNGRRFRARRELVEIEEADLSEVVLDATAAGGAPPVRFTVAGSERPSFLRGRAFALPAAEMRRLVGELRAHGFFAAAEADPAHLADDEGVVVVRVGDLSRTGAFGRTDAGLKARDALFDVLNATATDFAWQVWWDIDKDPTWSLFFGENVKWFHENREPGARAARHRAMVAESLDDLVSVEDRLFATAFVAGLPGGGGALSQAEAGAFVSAVAAESEANAFVAAVVELLVPAAGERAALGLVDALANKLGPAGQGMLVRVCASLPGTQIQALCSEPRWKVRRAALQALVDGHRDLARPTLFERLKDDEVLVRVTAATALATAKESRVIDALKELAGHESPDVRGAAGFALGLLGGEEALRSMGDLLHSDPSPDVRVRSVEGLVAGGDPRAPDQLLAVFQREADVRVRAAAATGLVKLETPDLVARLIQRLELTDPASLERVALVNVLSRFRSDATRNVLLAVLKGDDTLSQDAAALGLARRWEEASIPQLIRMTRAGRNARSAVLHLKMVTSREFDTESYPAQADNYSAWFQAAATGNPRAWFVEALTLRGYDTSALQDLALATGPNVPPVPDEAVPLLLRVLRDKDWYLQRNASYLLSLRIGAEGPEPVSHLTSPEELEATIRAYNDWWAALVAKSESERRG